MEGYIPKEIDHINGVRDDNRWSNLREVTRQQNAQNMHDSKGYYYNKRQGKYHVQIKCNYKNIHIGYYSTEQEAQQAAKQAKEMYHVF